MLSNQLPEGEVEYVPASNWSGVIRFDVYDPTLGPTVAEMIKKYCHNCRLHLSNSNLTCDGFGSAGTGTTEGANLSSAETIKESSLPYLAECLRQQK